MLIISLLLFHPAFVYKVPAKVAVGQDVYQPAEPGQVTLEGFLGGRMCVNREGRLKKHITEEQLLAGFRNRPGSHPWIGEHVGKWLHAATLAWENKPDDMVLKQEIEQIAEGVGYIYSYANRKAELTFAKSIVYVTL